jgi:hypothetical protein
MYIANVQFAVEGRVIVLIMRLLYKSSRFKLHILQHLSMRNFYTIILSHH